MVIRSKSTARKGRLRSKFRRQSWRSALENGNNQNRGTLKGFWRSTRNRSARRRLAQLRTSAPSPKFLGFRCVQNGSSARREEGAYLDRYVTDEQRSSRPIFNATLRAAASWLFFRVARSTVTIQIAALRSRLEKQPTDLRRNPRDLGDGALVRSAVAKRLASDLRISEAHAETE